MDPWHRVLPRERSNASLSIKTGVSTRIGYARRLPCTCEAFRMSFSESRIREARCHEPRAQQRCPALRLSVMRRYVRPGAGVLGITSICSEWRLTFDRHIEAQVRRLRNIRLWLLYRSLWWLCTDCLPKSIHYQTISSHLLTLNKLVNQDTK